jgi:hypothetical protein
MGRVVEDFSNQFRPVTPQRDLTFARSHLLHGKSGLETRLSYSAMSTGQEWRILVIKLFSSHVCSVIVFFCYLNFPFSMDYPRRNFNLVRGRRDFRWDQRFCVRRPEAYAAQDRHILFDEVTNRNIAPTDTKLLVDAFLDSERSDLDPPCFVFDTLREFLERADIKLLTIHQGTSTPLRELALVDDRRDVTGGTGYLAVIDLYKRKRTVAGANTNAAEIALFEEMVKVAGGTDFRRNWESKLYMEQSPEGDKPLIFARPLNERELYTRLEGEVWLTT